MSQNKIPFPQLFHSCPFIIHDWKWQTCRPDFYFFTLTCLFCSSMTLTLLALWVMKQSMMGECMSNSVTGTPYTIFHTRRVPSLEPRNVINNSWNNIHYWGYLLHDTSQYPHTHSVPAMDSKNVINKINQQININRLNHSIKNRKKHWIHQLHCPAPRGLNMFTQPLSHQNKSCPLTDAPMDPLLNFTSSQQDHHGS